MKKGNKEFKLMKLRSKSMKLWKKGKEGILLMVFDEVFNE
jgi:hypothetical protein